jgi:CheY-like chemotaxis protein
VGHVPHAPASPPLLDPLLEPLLDPLLEPLLDPLLEPLLDPLLEPLLDPLLEPLLDPLLEPLLEPLLDEPLDDVLPPSSPVERGELVVPPLQAENATAPKATRAQEKMAWARMVRCPYHGTSGEHARCGTDPRERHRTIRTPRGLRVPRTFLPNDRPPHVGSNENLHFSCVDETARNARKTAASRGEMAHQTAPNCLISGEKQLVRAGVEAASAAPGSGLPVASSFSRNAPNPFPPEPQSEAGAAKRIEELRSNGEPLDAVLRRARRLTARERSSARAPIALIVDDFAENRDLYAIGLVACGFEVHTAEDGAEAVDKALALRPDVIVLDFAMPNMDGGEAARRLAADERTRAIPIVMLSAFADLVPREVRLGCAAFLAKPCTAEDLAALLQLIVAARDEALPGGA